MPAPDEPAEDRGSSRDHRFAGLPASEAAAAIEVTPGIPERAVTRGEVILDRTFTINQASEALAIAGSSTGYGAVRVDDVMTRGQARAIEQALIARNAGFENEINSISPTHSYYDDAVSWGEAWLRQNGF